MVIVNTSSNHSEKVPRFQVRRTAAATTIVVASKMGLPVTNTFCGGDASKNVDENWDEALKVWPDLVSFAQDHGVKLTFENCPMIFSYDEWPGGHNIAYSPYIWRRILEAWGGTVGLNHDPSHLVWLMIDQGRFIREFADHIYHFQAKDVMIDADGLYEYRLAYPEGFRGGASAIVSDLAMASQGVFYLLDLIEAPSRDDEEIRLLRSDREALKRKLIDQARARGERPTPVAIDQRISAAIITCSPCHGQSGSSRARH